ncbi:MAG: ATP-dependent DNA helicase RecG [Chitinivibrionales bacterium]|nr:ATP-dependent DNA helicase RecG [Chitinivibrionales bacterium]
MQLSAEKKYFSFMVQKKFNPRIDFISPLRCVAGLGEKRVAALQESGLNTVGDLLYYVPYRYLDRSKPIPMGTIDSHIGQICTVIGTITHHRVEAGRSRRLRIRVEDSTGSIEAVWFAGLALYQKILVKGKKVLLLGKITHYRSFEMVHPQVEVMRPDQTSVAIPFFPHYHLTEAMVNVHLQHKVLAQAIEWILKNLKHYPQTISQELEKKKGFPPLSECLRQIHFPADVTKLKSYYDRLRYEELYHVALMLERAKQHFKKAGRSLHPGDFPEIIKKKVPFTLSADQLHAIDVLLADAASHGRMHRLLQGDVGSGKTIVAFISCCASLHEGLQVAWLLPTELLARQTFNVVTPWLEWIEKKAELLVGSLGQHEKSELLNRLADGRCQFVVGTHALLQESVVFHKLGIAVVDEQHKFGALQRTILQQKDPAADFLLMTATPIPQTLTKTLFGDLDLICLRSIPRGPRMVTTHVVPEQKRDDMLVFIQNHLAQQQCQVFWIAPQIGDTEETTDEEPAKLSEPEQTFFRGREVSDTRVDVTAIGEALATSILAGIPRAILHGRLTTQQKEMIMDDFRVGRTKILIATTIIEVGIDIAAATIMVIEGAERFGLSQLHQLRGRVGRSGSRSYVFLLPQKNCNNLAEQRLRQFCVINDGFALAELDLQLRGPGQIAGFTQSGWDELQFADIIADKELFSEIQAEVQQIYPSGMA